MRSLSTLRVLLAVGALPCALALGACPSEPPSAKAPTPPAPSVAPVDSAAVSALDEGEREIGAAAGDCGRACEGLSRMVQARARLCAPRSSACEAAEGRALQARARVWAFCDPCGDGP